MCNPARVQIKRLHAEKEELEQQVELLKARCRKIEEEAAEQRALDEKKHGDEVRGARRGAAASSARNVEGHTADRSFVARILCTHV